ncbi:MAG: energy transducer TonB [Candidatus Cloacimonetes bacterium]|nr:energy transducer TonB [Candidatus Cloacimonadota bacterium]
MLKMKNVQKIMLFFLVVVGLLYSIDDSIISKTKIDSSKFVVFDVAPKALKRFAPIYPEEEKKYGKEGKIWLEVEISKNGTVGEVNILGNETGSEALAKSSIEATKKWKYEPAYRDGKPITCWVKFPVVFTLK